MITRVLLVVLLVGCGGAAASTAPEEPSSSAAAEPVAAPAPPAQGGEADAMSCSVDAECMVGTPSDCCTSFCGDDPVAWSLSAWAAYQQRCSMLECEQTESIACRPEVAGAAPPVAVCEAQRCVLRAATTQ